MSHRDKDNRKDIDIDKDIDVDIHKKNETINKFESEKDIYVDVDVDKDVDVDVKKEVEVDVDVNKYVDVDVDVDVDKHIKEKVEKWNVEVDVKSDSIVQDAKVLHDEDVNDVDTSELIDVDYGAELNMDDFSLDILSIGDSFNGQGNDGHLNVSQSNNLDDNDEVRDTEVEYENYQAPDIEAELKLGGKGNSVTHLPQYGMSGLEAAASTALYAELSLKAPDSPFQSAYAEGGESYAGDGIGEAELESTNSDNEGDGAVTGDAAATADAAASAKAFTADIIAGGNQQANFATINVVGGNLLDGGDVAGQANGVQTQAGGHHGGHGGGHGSGDGLAIKDSWVSYDDDLNDLDTSELIEVDPYGELKMDDFNLDMDAIAESFNGPGNDWAFDVTQTNDLVDNDKVTDTHVSYKGAFWNGSFQDVTAYGGSATSGDGIGDAYGNGVANSNGGNGMISGSTSASADAIANAEAFTANIVVGANLQVNNMSATVVGGDSTIVDDITA